jgi:hypothetical protein
MNFQNWFEAKFDPSITHLYKLNYQNKPFVRASYNLKIDGSGNVVPMSEEDWDTNIPHFEIKPREKKIALYQYSPQSTQFNKLIHALQVKYHDIYDWDVEIFFQAGHMQTGNRKWNRNVNYWLKNTINFANKIPKYAYHGTSSNLWNLSIKKNGLLPRNVSGSMGSYGAQNVTSLSRGNLIYLSTHPDAAARTAAEQAAEKHGGRPIIIQIDTSGLFPEKFDIDEDARKVKTPHQSIEMMSAMAYREKIPASILKPYLIGERKSEGNYNFTKWEKYHDVDIDEHPLTKRLKRGELPYRGDVEYYALKDAGIIGKEEVYLPSGHRQEKHVLKRDVTDAEIQKILHHSGWAQNAKAIEWDLNKGYGGIIYPLQGLDVTEKLLSDPLIKMLLKSNLLYVDHNSFRIQGWEPEDKIIMLAKLMGKMSFAEFTQQLKNITPN